MTTIIFNEENKEQVTYACGDWVLLTDSENTFLGVIAQVATREYKIIGIEENDANRFHDKSFARPNPHLSADDIKIITHNGQYTMRKVNVEIKVMPI